MCQNVHTIHMGLECVGGQSQPSDMMEGGTQSKPEGIVKGNRRTCINRTILMNLNRIGLISMQIERK